jgi:formylglycine-generating enzyme required for sulfatase activity
MVLCSSFVIMKKVGILLFFVFISSTQSFAEESVSPTPHLQDMVLIPAGIYQQGCNKFGLQHGAPEHPVFISAFMIDKYEVSNKRFEEIFPEHKLRRSQFSSCDDCPVSKLSWYEAADYCHLTGKSLPSESQWEKAAGGDTGCEFPWGKAFDLQEPQARGGLKLKQNASPVAQFLPNNYGLYDMGGNIWEWVSDWYSADYYQSMEMMLNPRGPNRGIMKVRRGGSWSDSVIAMHAGYRDWSNPHSRGFNDIGFRCSINLKYNFDINAVP